MWSLSAIPGLSALPSLHLSVQTDPDPESGSTPSSPSNSNNGSPREKPKILGVTLPLHGHDGVRSPSPPLTAPVLRMRGVRRRWIVGLLVLLLFLVFRAVAPMTKPVLTPAEALQQWGASTPRAAKLMKGISPWPPRIYKSDTGVGSDAPYSTLGAKADNSYNPGPRTMPTYAAQLIEFVKAFPKKQRPMLLAGIERFLSASLEIDPDPVAAWDYNRTVWQTDKSGETRDSETVQTWKNGPATQEGWEWKSLSDDDAWDWARKHLRGSGVGTLWASLPSGILRADLLRYLLILLHGGIYTDTDTHLLRPPSQWTHQSRAWKDGEGWMTDKQRSRMSAGEPLEDVLGKPSIIIGIEADVGDRPDWSDWWPRPLQIIQWTMASAPGHPIALQSALRVLHSTAKAAEWAAIRARKLKVLESRVRSTRSDPPTAEYDTARAELEHLRATTVTSPVPDGGPVGVLDWTGPGVWTDATLDYLGVKYGVRWTDLRGLTHPTRIGDVLVLPVTGFSPGVGQFGAGETTDPLAMVWHMFRGSWRGENSEPEVAPMHLAGA